ncbi:MAG: Ig-like domain-containing protein [Sandaracinaceae bacterium]
MSDAGPPDAGATDAGEDAGDTTAPTITGISPMDGEAGVPVDAEVVITFSEPMDQVSVEGAFQGTCLGGVSFSWNLAGTEMTATPDDLLAAATGTIPGAVTALEYEFGLDTTAYDLAGNTLASPSEVSFTTARRITQRLTRITSLTGVVLHTGVGATDFMATGDTGTGGDPSSFYKAAMSFGFDILPPATSGIASATLEYEVERVANDNVEGVFPMDLGALTLVSVDFSAMDTSFIDAAGPLAATLPSANGPATVDVSDAVSADFAARSRTQFRMEFEFTTDGDRAGDFIEIALPTVTLDVDYWLP